MRRILFFIILVSANIFAYVDSDMDGVEDSVDKCPNTSLMDLADVNGCSIKSLVDEHHYDVIVGINFSDADYRSLNATDTLATSFQVDYYYKQYSIQASTSYYVTDGSSYDDSGLYDSFIGASYRLNKINDLSISLTAGVILPTYDTDLNNNKMDYTTSVNLSYPVENINLFGGYTLTIVNDDDVGSVTYKNTKTISLGAGSSLSSKLYVSASYVSGDSIYRSIEDIQTVSLYGYYSINDKLFSTVNYAKGLSNSASDNYLSIRIGHLF